MLAAEFTPHVFLVWGFFHDELFQPATVSDFLCMIIVADTIQNRYKVISYISS